MTQSQLVVSDHSVHLPEMGCTSRAMKQSPGGFLIRWQLPAALLIAVCPCSQAKETREAAYHTLLCKAALLSGKTVVTGLETELKFAQTREKLHCPYLEKGPVIISRVTIIWEV